MPLFRLPNTICSFAFVAKQAEMYCNALVSLLRGVTTERPVNVIPLGERVGFPASGTTKCYLLHGLDCFGINAGPEWRVQLSVAEGAIPQMVLDVAFLPAQNELICANATIAQKKWRASIDTDNENRTPSHDGNPRDLPESARHRSAHHKCSRNWPPVPVTTGSV